nr:MAG TPA: hypothetical protein [Caudoviricetes sp.]
MSSDCRHESRRSKALKNKAFIPSILPTTLNPYILEN